jgi:hypothetical protein
MCFNDLKSFKAWLSACLTGKSFLSNLTRVDSTKSCIPSSEKTVYQTTCPVHMPINKMGQQNANIST